jgi:vitamin B12 transporter
MKRVIVTVLLFSISPLSYAQVKKLKEVKVRNRKVNTIKLTDDKLNLFASGMKVLPIDSQLLAQYQLQSLSQLLTQQVPVFIKSYGINSMATLNFRGSSAAQSQVIWNGVPLNSASSGITDVSTLSVGNFEQIKIAYGSSSALLGSGNIGAAILLDNNFEASDSLKKWQTSIGSEIGSFGQLKWNIQERYSSKKLYASIKLMQQSAKNDFEYQAQNGTVQRMTNARLKSKSGMLNLAYQFNKYTSIHFAAWYQHFDREIPPALFEQFSIKRQQDNALRLMLGFEKLKKSLGKVYSKTAYLQDYMNYTDVAILLESNNKAHQLYQEFGWKKSLPKGQEILVFAPITVAWMLPDLDTMTRYQNRIALAANYSVKAYHERIQFALNMRIEKINDQNIFLPGANVSYALYPFLKVRANIQRSYRAPTLNEWYFRPGGNINLKPEQGWNIDAGYELKLTLNNCMLLQHDISIFNRKIKDWILWFGGSIWTPHNIAEVHSRGIESTNSFHFKQGNWHFNIGLNTSFVLATTLQSYISNDGSIGKQIPYSPRYNGQANLGLGFKKISFNYNHSYIGYRFTTTDESQYLLPYQTGNIYISTAFTFKQKLQYNLNLACNNIWNTDYKVVHQRPMPMRNWALGLAFVF